MPTYDYECTKCGHVFEMMQSITARPKRTPDQPCEGCGKKAPIRRLMGTGGAILFKGSGFYETDYRSEGYKKAAEAEKKSQSGGSDKSDSAASGSSKSDSSGSAPGKADSGKTDSSKTDSGKTESGKSDSSKKSSPKSEPSKSSSGSGKSKSKD